MLRISSLLVIVLGLSFLVNYYILLGKKKNEIKDSARKIDSSLADYFDYTEKVLVFVGKQISEDEHYKDLNYIHKVFTDVSYAQGYSDIFSWTMFDWVDRQNRQTVNTMTGINTKNPPDMSVRGYTWKGRAELWNIQFSNPTVGNPSGIYVLPVGVGVGTTNQDGNVSYSGNVVVGLNIKRLVNKLTPLLAKNCEFMVINYSNYDFVFGSHHDINSVNDVRDLIQYADEAKKLNTKHDLSSVGFIEKIEVGKSHYIYSQPMDIKYPYIILIGYDNGVFWREVFSSTLILLTQIVMISLVVVMTLRNFRAKS